MSDLDILEKVMRETSDERFDDTLTKAVLNLSDEQIKAVSFVFWLTYTAEKDLYDIFKKTWEFALETAPDTPTVEHVRAEIKEMLEGKKSYKDELEKAIDGLEEQKQKEILGIVGEYYQKKRDVDVDKLDYFIDKIRLFEVFFGKTDFTTLLWKLNGLRNKVSHGDIDTLEYNGESLHDRSAREQLFLDFIRATSTADFSESKMWKSLSDEEKASVEAVFEAQKKKL